jgi:hypothetical protein
VNIEVGKTYNVKVWDSVENVWWEDGGFTVTEFISTGPYAGAYHGLDSEGLPGIVEPEEFVSEVK